MKRTFRVSITRLFRPLPRNFRIENSRVEISLVEIQWKETRTVMFGAVWQNTQMCLISTNKTLFLFFVCFEITSVSTWSCVIMMWKDLEMTPYYITLYHVAVHGSVGWLIACLTSQQHASGRICSDNFTCCHTQIEVADQTFYLTKSQYTDTGPTSPSPDPITPGAWQGSHWSANF